MSPHTSPFAASVATNVKNVISTKYNPLFTLWSARPTSNSPVHRAVAPQPLADVVVVQAGFSGD